MSNTEARGRAVPPRAASGEAAPAPGSTAAEPASGASGASPESPGSAWWASPGGHAAGRRPRGRWVAAGVVVVVAAAVGAAAASGVFGARGQPGSVGSGHAAATQPVTRQTLTSQTQVDGTLGDAGSWSVVVPPSGSSSSSSSSSASSNSGSGSGTFTWLPAAGQTVRQGHVIYKVSGSPVVLLYGQIPAYRTLSEGMTGADVIQLNHDLVRLGYANSTGIAALGWDYFSSETGYALELLQSHLGIASPSGELSLGSAVFLPGPALITALGSSAVLGGPVSSGTVVATASSTTPVVTIALDASLQSEVKDGDPVSITLPDGTTTPGMISQISRVASSSSNNSSSSNSSSSNNSGSSSGSSTITVLVSLDHPGAAGRLNQAPVTVTITTGSVPDTLAVPVDALLAQPGGGYAVEVTGRHGHRMVPVSLGLIDNQAGMVQVSGSLTPGQRVVVPGS